MSTETIPTLSKFMYTLYVVHTNRSHNRTKKAHNEQEIKRNSSIMKFTNFYK